MPSHHARGDPRGGGGGGRQGPRPGTPPSHPSQTQTMTISVSTAPMQVIPGAAGPPGAMRPGPGGAMPRMMIPMAVVTDNGAPFADMPQLVVGGPPGARQELDE